MPADNVSILPRIRVAGRARTRGFLLALTASSGQTGLKVVGLGRPESPKRLASGIQVRNRRLCAVTLSLSVENEVPIVDQGYAAGLR